MWVSTLVPRSLQGRESLRGRRSDRLRFGGRRGGTGNGGGEDLERSRCDETKAAARLL